MKKVLLCSIIRNQQDNLNLWFDQIKKITEEISFEYECYLSIFENDSVDNTKEMLSSFDFSFLKDFLIQKTTLKTEQYGSIWSIKRIQNLAFYRQSCIDNGFNKFSNVTFDKIAFIEPDTKYNPKWSKELILAKHPESVGIKPDVYSGWSLRSNKNPKESMYLYDTCASRQLKSDIYWNFHREDEWKNQSLIKTFFSHEDSYCLHSIYSTFNCFCVYNAEPFYKGIKWGYTNDRLNPSNIKVNDNEYLECDTVNIVETFRKNNYDKIFLNRNCIIRHL